MNTESNIEKLARLYKEEKFTKEQMAEEMFKNGADFPTVVRVVAQWDFNSNGGLTPPTESRIKYVSDRECKSTESSYGRKGKPFHGAVAKGGRMGNRNIVTK